MKVKDDFHRLIDSIENEELLMNYYQLVQNINSDKSTRLWNRLSEEQKEDLLLSYTESFNADNLISHEEVKHQHEKWLKP